MEYKEIEHLLNKYLEGETTLQEEALLKEYFDRDDLPEHQPEIVDMFRYFASAQRQEAPPFDVNAELNGLVDRQWKKQTRYRFAPLARWVAGTAAVLAISFGLFQFLNKPETQLKDTYNDPNLAYLQAKEVLLLVSNTMNRNTSKLRYLSAIDKSYSGIRQVAEIDKVVNSVKNK